MEHLVGRERRVDLQRRLSQLQQLFRAALQGARLVTNGGRVLDVVGTGATVADARASAYAGVACIDFSGMQFRSDIGA